MLLRSTPEKWRNSTAGTPEVETVVGYKKNGCATKGIPNFCPGADSNFCPVIGNIAMRTEEEGIMEKPVHSLTTLFAQLGQPSDEASIAQFIESHRPLAGDVMLHEAAFWTPSQASFLCEAIRDDADWAEVADELNAELRARH
jgi:hypothetical protein